MGFGDSKMKPPPPRSSSLCFGVSASVHVRSLVARCSGLSDLEHVGIFRPTYTTCSVRGKEALSTKSLGPRHRGEFWE